MQPKRRRPLNLDYGARGTDTDFVGEVEFQHLTDTYLGLLGAPGVGWNPPVVADVEPRYGSEGDDVTINAAKDHTFTKDCVVDFSSNAVDPNDVKVSADGRTITATVPGDWTDLGLAYVYVTNRYGISNPAWFVYDE